MYIRNVHLTTKKTLYSLAIRRAIVFWNIIYAYITVNLHWSELNILSG